MTTKDECSDGGLLESVGKKRFGTILIDPPWRFANKTGKIAPEHKRLAHRAAAPCLRSELRSWLTIRRDEFQIEPN
jgi:hypothetical protein